MKRITLFTTVCAAALALLVGCTMDTPDVSEAASGPSEEGKQFLAAAEPTDAKDVLAVREEVADGDEVTVVGRIGGDVNPWIDGRAAFSIVDNSLKACSDIPGDLCETPWDYCCEADLANGMALIKVVDDQGETVKTDARELLGVKELSTVVVQGKAQRDDSGNLTILAQKLYVK